MTYVYYGLRTRKVGGLRFWRWGRLGGSFYLAR
jgi:hypothetical protein